MLGEFLPKGEFHGFIGNWDKRLADSNGRNIDLSAD